MDLEIKSMVRVQKETYWASPQEPRFLCESPPFPRQAPFLSASLPLCPRHPSQPDPNSPPFGSIQGCQMAKKFPLGHLPTPFKPQHFVQCYTDRTHRLPTMNMQAAQIIHDRMDHSSAISSKGQVKVSWNPYFYLHEGAMRWCEDRIPHERDGRGNSKE